MTEELKTLKEILKNWKDIHISIGTFNEATIHYKEWAELKKDLRQELGIKRIKKLKEDYDISTEELKKCGVSISASVGEKLEISKGYRNRLNLEVTAIKIIGKIEILKEIFNITEEDLK